MMKGLIVGLMCLLFVGCSDLDESPGETMEDKEIKGVTHFVTKTGVECINFKWDGYKSGGGGISCNWQKFNQDK